MWTCAATFWGGKRNPHWSNISPLLAWIHQCLLPSLPGVALLERHTALRAFLHAAEDTSYVAWGGVVTGFVLQNIAFAVLLSSVELLVHAPHKLRENACARYSWLFGDGRGVQVFALWEVLLASRH